MAQTVENVAFTEGFVEADGFRIRYMQAGSGEPVLRIHGAGGLQLTRSDAILAQKFRTIAIEIPGFGASTNERSMSARDLGRTVAAFAQALDLERYNVIGDSAGAKIALWQALETGDRIDALVLVAPASILPDDWRPPVISDRRSLMFAHPERQPEPAPVDTAQRDKVRAFMRRALPTARDVELEERLGEIDVATLVVFGTEDRIIPPEMGRIYRAKMPNCSYALVYDAGHAIEAERPEAAAELIGDFLERREVFVVARESTVINP